MFTVIRRYKFYVEQCTSYVRHVQCTSRTTDADTHTRSIPGELVQCHNDLEASNGMTTDRKTGHIRTKPMYSARRTMYGVQSHDVHFTAYIQRRTLHDTLEILRKGRVDGYPHLDGYL